MGINFPQVKEIRLKNPPLSEVICQVKFPPILKLGSGVPVDFQDAIRSMYPGFEIEQPMTLQLGIGDTADSPVVSHPRIFHFTSIDKQSIVTLSVDFFALMMKKYIHWKDFRDQFDFVQGIVNNLLKPPYASRVGLRFINRFSQNNTQCKSLNELLDLFRDELVCLIRSEAWSTPVEYFSHIVLEDRDAKMVLRTGLGKENNPFFILDFDYFEEGQIDLQNISKRVEHYHSVIYKAFRWCIKDSSLAQFNPIKG